MSSSASFRFLTQSGKPYDKPYDKIDLNDLLIEVNEPNHSDPSLVDTGPSAADDDLTVEQLKLLGVWSPVTYFIEMGHRFVIVPRQKILIVDSKNKPDEGSTINLPLHGEAHSQQPVRVVRVSECPNPDTEYGHPTHTVLVEWETGAETLTFGLSVAVNQSENFVIVGNPNGKPGPPITAARHFEAGPSDFVAVTPADKTFYATQPDSKVVVAVLDTGLKYSFAPLAGGRPYHYTDAIDAPKSFQVPQSKDAGSGCSLHDNTIGYCGITGYMRASNEATAYDSRYHDNPALARFNTLSKQAILNSPFDDNIGREQLANGTWREGVGRHGSTITAIINQQGTVSVLPVKTFDNTGFSTLFDLLCGFNYILAKQAAGMPVKLVNASFIGALGQHGLMLLTTKFNALAKANIWVITAAGNAGLRLGDSGRNMMYPACFSDKLPNVITVSGVKRFYKLVPRKGSRARPVLNLSKASRYAFMRELNLLPYDFDILAVYIPVYNTSNVYVSAAVCGPLPSPFSSRNGADTQMLGTSFTAAYFSARVAKYLLTTSTLPSSMAAKNSLINALTRRAAELDHVIKGGRVMTL